jgi:transposase
MKIIRKKYTEEFKREAVALVSEHGYNYRTAGSSLGVNPQLLAKWHKKFTNGSSILSKDEPLHKKLRELEAENRRLRMEREILKKAAAFFAKENM